MERKGLRSLFIVPYFSDLAVPVSFRPPEAARHLRPEWGIVAPLRALEVADGRVHKLWRPEMRVRSREHAGESLACFNKANIF